VARSVCVAAVGAETHYQRLLIAAASVLAVRMQKKQAACELMGNGFGRSPRLFAFILSPPYTEHL
jgi:hypothetical protein